MKKESLFTEKEDLLIVETIKNNPQNLQQCFRELSKQLDKSRVQIENRYYSKLRKTYPIFMIVTPKGYILNNKTYKNLTTNNITNISRLWKRCLRTLL